jgi:adenylate cyclase, class 2
MAHGDREVEIKVAVDNAVAARRLLRQAGFRVARRRVFEANTVFDNENLALRSASSLLRVRKAGAKVTVTYKGPPEYTRHKSREELETEVANAGSITAILARLGFCPAFRYEKYRTEYRQPRASGLVTLDETPIGVYLELEGTASWIDRTARKLGFAPGRYITASYAKLYLDWCRERGVEPGEMVFS